MMVGGPIFVARPELVSVVGADFTAIDARQAVAAAEAFAAGRPGRC
jgi:methanogenic corrinoid protein MtbC1